MASETSDPVTDRRGNPLREGDRLSYKSHPDHPVLRVSRITDRHVRLDWLGIAAQDSVELRRERLPESPWVRCDADGPGRASGG